MSSSRTSWSRPDPSRGAQVGEVRALSLAPAATPAELDQQSWSDPAKFEAWRIELRHKVLDASQRFRLRPMRAELAESGVEVAGDILLDFVAGGKCLRSTYMYLGWLAGSADSDEALFASAGLELLHAFALLQDDVMDAASSRRGRPAAHIQFSQWHRNRKLSGPAERFGESAAILLGDLCLIWAEQMLRESGVEHRSLQQAWPRYDAMRTELAVGQFADLASDVRDLPSMDTVLEVARRKSGNYTVRRPLEIGAAMSGCSDRTDFRPGPLRRSDRRSLPAARRPAGGVRLRDGDRQARRTRPGRTQGHQRGHCRAPAGRPADPQAARPS